MRDFLQKLKVHSSKTKQFCDTYSNDECCLVQKDEILRILWMLRDFFKFWLWHCQKWSSYASLQKWQVECGADGLVPWRFRILPPHLSKLLRLPPKSDARSYEVLHLSRKIIVANLKISKMKPLSGNHHLTSWHLWWRCLLYNACHLKYIFADPLQRPTPAIIFAIATKPSCCAPIAPATHNHILTSKNGLKPSVFNTFDLWMCFAPQQRALFRHLNFQKWSECVVSLAFRLRNVLRSTTPCTFSTTQLPKVLRRLTRRFSEAIFPPSGATKTFKNHRVSRWPLNF